MNVDDDRRLLELAFQPLDFLLQADKLFGLGVDRLSLAPTLLGGKAIERCWILLYIAVYPHYKRCIEETMAKAKTTTLTFRIEPGLKEALRTAADSEHRSIANMVEVLIRDYCGRNGIAIPEQGALFDESQKPRSGTK